MTWRLNMTIKVVGDFQIFLIFQVKPVTMKLSNPLANCVIIKCHLVYINNSIFVHWCKNDIEIVQQYWTWMQASWIVNWNLLTHDVMPNSTLIRWYSYRNVSTWWNVSKSKWNEMKVVHVPSRQISIWFHSEFTGGKYLWKGEKNQRYFPLKSNYFLGFSCSFHMRVCSGPYWIFGYFMQYVFGRMKGEEKSTFNIFIPSSTRSIVVRFPAPPPNRIPNEHRIKTNFI